MSELVRGICRGDTPPKDIARTREHIGKRVVPVVDELRLPLGREVEDVPFAQRRDCMSLQTIGPADSLRGDVKNYKDWDMSLTTVDILKAQPSLGHATSTNNDPLPWRLTEKPPLEVVKGSFTRTLYPRISESRPVDLSMRTSDIKDAQPRRIGLNTEGRARHFGEVNPLTPRYSMTSSEAPALPTAAASASSGRDALDVKDINNERLPNGSKPLRPHGQVGDPLKCEEEFRSKPQGPYSPKRTGELEELLRPTLEGPRRSLRQTDTLQPMYSHPVASGLPATSLHYPWSEEQRRMGTTLSTETHSIGPVPNSSPRMRTRDNGEPFLSLQTGDLNGAQPSRRIGRLPYSMYGPPGKRQQSASLTTADIGGAQAGTLCRGPRSRRLETEDDE